MYADAKAEYLALPVEKRTTTQLAKMAKGYLSRANALEKECDGKMDEVIRAMETLIRDNNGRCLYLCQRKEPQKVLVYVKVRAEGIALSKKREIGKKQTEKRGT